MKKFFLLFVFVLLMIYPPFIAQESATEEALPPSPTLEPSFTPVPTETPLPSETATELPSVTPLPTETPTETATVSPTQAEITAEVTELPSPEITAEVTAELTVEPSQTATATATGTSTATATSNVSISSNLAYTSVAYHDVKSYVDLRWGINSNWQVLELNAEEWLATGSNEALEVWRGTGRNALIETEFILPDGILSLSLRESERGSYRLDVDSSGNFILWKGGIFLNSASIAALGNTKHQLRFRSHEGQITAELDGNMILAFSDATPLPEGHFSMNIQGSENFLLRYVDIAITEAEYQASLALIPDTLAWNNPVQRGLDSSLQSFGFETGSSDFSNAILFGQSNEDIINGMNVYSGEDLFLIDLSQCSIGQCVVENIERGTNFQTTMTETSNEYQYAFHPRWSPDRSKILFIYSGPETEWYDFVYVMDAFGSETTDITQATRITTMRTGYYSADWSPDGQFIVRDAFPERNLYLVDYQACNQVNNCADLSSSDTSYVTLLTNIKYEAGMDYIESNASWSPDGSQIAYLRDPFFSGAVTGPAEIYAINPDVINPDGFRDASAITNTAYEEQSFDWSPDGLTIVYQARESLGAKFRLYLIELDDTANPYPITPSTETAIYPTWSPDGQHIAFLYMGQIGLVDVSDFDNVSAPMTVFTASTDLEPLFRPDWGLRYRDVIPEAQVLHDHAREIGLPMPFDTAPIDLEQVSWTQGYGPNEFSQQQSVLDHGAYDDTHEYHTGVDFSSSNLQVDNPLIVRAVCDGVILSGRIPGNNGGSTKANTGLGFALRCFQDDAILIDPDGDGHRNLSNIVVVYNHVYYLNDGSFPSPGNIVREGDTLAQTSHYYACSATQCTRTDEGRGCEVVAPYVGTCDTNRWKVTNHLHLEIFIARGFRDGVRSIDNLPATGDGYDAIRINPLFMFRQDIATASLSMMEAYYPVRFYQLCYRRGRECASIRETEPFDFNDNDDLDYGIHDFGIVSNEAYYGVFSGELTPVIITGDIVRNEDTRGRFWTRQSESVNGIQIINVTGPEWTQYSILTSQNLVDYLFSNQNEPTIYRPNMVFTSTSPYCNNIFIDVNATVCENQKVLQDDADLNIPPQSGQ